MICVKGDKAFRDLKRVAEQWPKRTQALRKALSYEAAAKVKRSLEDKIPAGTAWIDYRNSLVVSEIQTGKENPAYVIKSLPRSRSVKSLDESTSIIYVRVKPRLKKPKESIQILEKYSPWTVDTIPFIPKRTDAILIKRTATSRLTDDIKNARNRDRLKWRSELARAGVSTQIIRSRRPGTDSGAVLDVAYEAYRLEFGMGVKPEPHWRPALTELRTSGIKKMARNPKIRMLFTDPSFTGWKRWEKISTQHKTRLSEAKGYEPFQRKLGIRV